MCMSECLHVFACACIYMYVWVCASCMLLDAVLCVCVCVAQEVQKMDIKFLEQELQMVASCPVWVLEPKSGPLEEQEVLLTVSPSLQFWLPENLIKQLEYGHILSCGHSEFHTFFRISGTYLGLHWLETLARTSPFSFYLWISWPHFLWIGLFIFQVSDRQAPQRILLRQC